MLNRFENCKSLFDLYNVFATEEGVQEYINLSDEELERVAIVFEANLPDKVDMPDVPLTKAGYNYIWNVVVEEVETNNNDNENSEEEEMNKNQKTQEAINKAAAEKARSIVGASKDFLTTAYEALLGLCDDAAKEARKISAMSQQQAEDYLKRKFAYNADKFIDWSLDHLNIEIERRTVTDSWFAPVGETVDSEETSRLKKAIIEFKKVKADGELKGWKKAKEILKAVFGILFATFVEVAKIVLKLVFTLAVGTVKVGACAIVTLLNCFGIAKDDIVKPIYGMARKAHQEHKATKAAKAVAVDILIDDEDLFEDEDDVVIE
jgi:vacuolar-type H+-ATPase subunit H